MRMHSIDESKYEAARIWLNTFGDYDEESADESGERLVAPGHHIELTIYPKAEDYAKYSQTHAGKYSIQPTFSKCHF